MNVRVRLGAWTLSAHTLSLGTSVRTAVPSHQERAPWLVKLPASSSRLTNSSTCGAWRTPTPHPKPSPFAPGLSSAAPSCTRPPMRPSPTNSAATPTPSPSGAAASYANDSTDSTTSRAVADRSLFPPQERHQVVILATTRPAEVGVPASRWSLDDLAY